MKPYFSLFLAISLLWLPAGAGPLRAQGNRNSVTTLVIDPGHGGTDPGCVHGNIREKNLNLSIALKFGKLVESKLPDVKVVYTRKTDVFVVLAERGNIANRAKADLFVSIHTDAVADAAARGNATFVMGLDKAGGNLDAVMRENDVIRYEEDYTSTYEGFVPGSAESYIIFSLMQYAYQEQSMDFAAMVQQHYGRHTTIRDRGARQGPYLVLWRTAMPSVLTEIGFLSNASDRKFITSAAGQDKIAQALFDAFSQYKSKIEGKTRATLPVTERPAATAAPAPAKAASTAGVVFRVQLSASSRAIDPKSSEFGPYAGRVRRIKSGTLYKYCIGDCATFSEALSLQRQAKKRFKDAFIVAFRGDAPVPITDDMKNNR